MPVTTLVRAPAHDSPIIKSDRLGGNFAYSVVEGHAFGVVTRLVGGIGYAYGYYVDFGYGT